jgi:hypothetical protein
MKKAKLGSKSTWGSFSFFIGMVAIVLITVIAINALPNKQASDKTSPSSNSPSNSVVNNQLYPSEGWKEYVSPLGYSIEHPPDWFASPDPAVDRADIIYDDKDFIKIRSGEKLVDHSQLSSYNVIGVQEFNFSDLNLNATATLENITRAIAGEGAKVLEESSFGASEDSLFRLVESQGEFRMAAYFINGKGVYMISSSLPNLMDSDRVDLFRQIASSFRITK